MRKWLYRACSILLSLILASNCILSVLAESDFDMDLSESEIFGDTVFIDASGETLDAPDEYSLVTIDGDTTEGETVTFNIEYGDGTNAYEFVGWYDGDTLISTNTSFTHTFGDYKLLTPVIKTHNVLSSGASFESITIGGNVKVPITDTESYYYKSGESYIRVKTGSAPTSNLWGIYSNFSYPTYEKVGEEYIAIENPVSGAYCGDSWGTVNAITGEYEHTYYTDYDNDATAKATVTVKPHSGNTMLGINSYWRHNIKELTGLKKNTDYLLSVWVYTQNNVSCLSWAAVASNYEGLRTGASTAHLESCEVLGVTGFTANYGEWTQLKIPFNSGENEVAYFHIGNTIGKISGGIEGMNFIDDLTVCEADAIDYTGTKELADNGTIRLSGATTSDAFNIALNYTGSAIEFNANCFGTVKLEYNAVPLAGYSLRFKVIVDGAEQEDFVIKDTLSGETVLAENLAEGDHSFKIVRATENFMGKVTITGVSIDGEYLDPPAKKTYNFDFYGDSLTAGYGTTYFTGDSDWSYYEDGSKSYAYLSSEALDANPNIFAYSGIGISVGSDPDGGGDTIPDRYATVPKNTNADIVVIYLGTNDKSKYSKLGLTIDDVIEDFSDFIKTVRNDYAKAKIVMLHYATTESIILPAVELAKTNGVTELYTLEVPCGASGAASHPNVEEQAETAEVVTEFLRGLLHEKISVKVEGNGAAKASASSAVAGTKITLTATPYLDSQFIGWYNGDDLVSEESVIEITVSENTNYTAKFTDQNLADGFAASDWKTGSTNNPTASASTEAHLGGTSVKLSGVRYQGMYLPLTGVTFKPDTTYKMQFSYRSPGIKLYTWGLIKDLSAATFNTPSGDLNNRAGNCIKYGQNENFITNTDWKKFSTTFTIGDTGYSNTALYIDFHDYIDATVTTGVNYAFISDISIVEVDLADEVTVDMKSCASIEPINFKMDEIGVNKKYTFKVVHNMTTEPVVKHNNTVLTPDSDGIYTFTSANSNAFSVRFDGDEALNDHDKDYAGNILSVYNDDVYLTNVWEGNIVYHETALFTPDREEAELLYPVDKVISLRSYDLKTNYIEGKDYEVTEDGKIKFLNGSRIPVYEGGLTTTTEPSSNKFPLRDSETEWLKSIGDTTYPQYAIAVTYEHSKTHTDGYIPSAPAPQGSKIENTLAKLEAGEEVNIVIFGDSISCGWSSSGLNSTNEIYKTDGTFASYSINVAPYAPTWANMLTARLKELYTKATINVKNLSLSGMSASWGANNIATRLAYWTDENGEQVVPDLLLTGFGVNDAGGGVSAESFKTSMQSIVTNARTASGNEKLEVLMYSGMLPNQRSSTWDAETRMLPLENAMAEIAAADDKVGVVKITSIFNEIIKSKNPEDYLNTNWNHGNDFTARIYATSILSAFENISEFKGNSIRATGNQGLRFKFKFDPTVIQNGYEGYTVKEIGALAIRTDYLNGAALEKDAIYNYNGKDRNAVSGIFYNAESGDNKLTEQGEAAAVLYNIGYNKSDLTTNYAAYEYSYSVRTYIVLSKGDTEITIYGVTTEASVFDIMNYIISKYEAESPTEGTQLYSDYHSVQDFMNSPVRDVNNKTISDSYTDWLKK